MRRGVRECWSVGQLIVDHTNLSDEVVNISHSTVKMKIFLALELSAHMA